MELLYLYLYCDPYICVLYNCVCMCTVNLCLILYLYVSLVPFCTSSPQLTFHLTELTLDTSVHTLF